MNKMAPEQPLANRKEKGASQTCPDRPYKDNLCASFKHAFEGLGYVLYHERNARLHLLAAVLVVAMGAWLQLSQLEWALIIAAIGLVFTGEMLNTVVELAIDLISPKENPLAKHAKDVAAGAILTASMVAMIIGIIVLGPPLWSRLTALVAN